jgi:CRISPR-associated protein Csb2
VIFGKFPKKSQVGPGKNGGKVFAELCEMINLPKPVEVRLGPASAFPGAPKASEFEPPMKFEDRLRAHVLIRFTQPVRGPVLIGAGRFAGFGLCRPWFGGKERP